MLYRYVAVLLLLGIILAGDLSLTKPVRAETHVQSLALTQIAVALRVTQAELQKWLPAPWEITSIPAGPLKGANLNVVFIDVLLLQDGQGKPDLGGINRQVVFGVSAKNTQTGEIAPFTIGGLASNTLNVPGPYKNFVRATLRREQTDRGADTEAGAGDDFWDIRGACGGIIELRARYRRALPSRAKSEMKMHSSAQPSFFRIYRIDSVTDIVKSIPAGIDRVQEYQLRVTVPEFGKLFDGTEQLVGIAVSPVYLREVFLP
ncbi:MAG: hypothetical protein ABSC55_14745 [Syntrophorhabdales bacterium]|jgi:hypothetical protein